MNWSDRDIRGSLISSYEAAAEAGTPLADLASEFGVTLDSLRHQLRRLRTDGLIKPYSAYKSHIDCDDPTQNETNIEIGASVVGVPYVKVLTNNPLEIKDLLEEGIDDMDRFHIDRYTRSLKKKYLKGADGDPVQVSEWALTAHFGLKKPLDVIKAAREEFLSDMATIRKSTNYTPFKVADLKSMDSTVIIEIFDFHLGNLIWHSECGEDWDINIAADLYKAVFTDLADRAFARGNIKRVILPIGNDFLHADNKEGTTTKGTKLALDTRWAKIYTVAGDLLIWATDYCRERCPRVDVIVVPGNHDELASFTLGQMLERVYRKVNGVSIDNSPSLRKYVQVGSTAIGFTHGSFEKWASLPLILLGELPKEMSATSDFREMHVGHLHHSRGAVMNEVYRDVRGVTIRQMPTLTPTDNFHTNLGFILNTKSAEALIYNDEEGLTDILVAHRKISLKSNN